MITQLLYDSNIYIDDDFVRKNNLDESAEDRLRSAGGSIQKKVKLKTKFKKTFFNKFAKFHHV